MFGALFRRAFRPVAWRMWVLRPGPTLPCRERAAARILNHSLPPSDSSAVTIASANYVESLTHKVHPNASQSQG